MLVEGQSPLLGRITLRVQRDGRSVTVDVVADGAGVVSHAGAALLAEAADRLGLTAALSRALAGVRERRGRHDPGRVVRDLAVMLADGGDCLADLRAVRDQEPLFGRKTETSVLKSPSKSADDFARTTLSTVPFVPLPCPTTYSSPSSSSPKLVISRVLSSIGVVVPLNHVQISPVQ